MELKKFFVLVLLLGSVCPAFCGGDTLHCRFYFPVGSAIPDLSYRDNGPRLDSFFNVCMIFITGTINSLK